MQYLYHLPTFTRDRRFQLATDDDDKTVEGKNMYSCTSLLDANFQAAKLYRKRRNLVVVILSCWIYTKIETFIYGNYSLVDRANLLTICDILQHI